MEIPSVARILERLQQIKAAERRDSGMGICVNLVCFGRERIPQASTWLRYQFPKWPKYSGNPEYPVPATQVGETGDSQYIGTRNLYNPGTEYGRLRLELLDFLIEQAKGELHGPE